MPTFPNAKSLVSRVEYKTAKADAAGADPSSYLRQTFEDSIHPVVEAGRTELYDRIYELLDCLTMRPAPGQAAGHIRIELKSQGAEGVFCGDILHSPLQVPFWQWSSMVCWDQDMSAQTRRELPEFCASENALLIPGHFEAPCIGRIRAAGDSFAINFGW